MTYVTNSSTILQYHQHWKLYFSFEKREIPWKTIIEPKTSILFLKTWNLILRYGKFIISFFVGET